MAPEALLVGRILRPHGLRGDAVVQLLTNRSERLAPGAELLAHAPGRGPEALRVERAAPLAKHWRVHFAGVETVDAAEALRGAELTAEPIEEAGTLWVHELIGAAVVDTDGVDHGRVVSVQENPASDLLVLDSGALVPLTFVVGHEPGVRVVVDVPEGLFDL